MGRRALSKQGTRLKAFRSPPAPPAWAASFFTVGVTGTNGKTSTTDMVAALLSVMARPVARVTTLGCFLDNEPQTVPKHYAGFLETLTRCHEGGGQYAALELTSEALGLGFAKAWPCNVGVFTNLSHDHSDAHESEAHYLAAKAQLFMALPKDGTAVLNVRDQAALLLTDVLPAGVQVIRYGVASRGAAWAPSDLEAEAVELSFSGSRAKLARSARFPDLPPELEILATGAVYVENALAALAAALAAGVPARAAIQKLATIVPPPGRFELVSRNPHVVVDYAHTPDALARTLSTARALCDGKLWLVFGAGGDRDRAKRPLLGLAARTADRIVLTSDNPRSEEPAVIMAEVESGIGAHSGLVREVNRARAIALAVTCAAHEDLVLIAGRGHERSQEVAGAMLPLSDADIVRQCIRSHQ